MKYRYVIAMLAGLTFVTPTAAPGQTTEARKNTIEQREASVPSKEAQERRQRSIARLQKEGVPTMKDLPVIEDSTEAEKRTTEEIAKRAIAVYITAVKGEGLDQKNVDSLVKQFGAAQFFSPAEASFITKANPTKQELINFSWRYECLWVLLWSLGYVDDLNRPEDACDAAKAVSFFLKRDTAQFIADAKLRPLADILDKTDLIYRYHWAVVAARLKGKTAPGKLDAGVVQEWHYVLNWLVGYMDQSWDDISTDT